MQKLQKFKNSIIKKKKKKHYKVLLLAKSIFNRKEVLISETLIDSVISHEKNIVLKQNSEIRKKTKI